MAAQYFGAWINIIRVFPGCTSSCFQFFPVAKDAVINIDVPEPFSIMDFWESCPLPFQSLHYPTALIRKAQYLFSLTERNLERILWKKV